MSVLKEVQPRVHALTGGLYANWMPPDHIDVGDYGVIARERFVRDGNLRDWAVDYGVETTKKSQGKLEYSDRATLSVRAAANLNLNLGEHHSSGASAHIKFSGKGAFLYHLSGITARRLENSRAFYEGLARRWVAGEINLEPNAVIVSEVRLATKATIVVSEGHEGTLEIGGNFPVDGQAILADVKGNLTVSHSAGNMFKWLAADGTIPVLGLVRPTLGPPGGGGGTPTAMASAIKWIRDLFRSHQWDIRAIRLESYVQDTASVPTMTLSVPTGDRIICQVAPLSIEEFNTLNQSIGTSTIEETIPIVKTRPRARVLRER
jgi:hypothetical protein